MTQFKYPMTGERKSPEPMGLMAPPTHMHNNKAANNNTSGGHLEKLQLALRALKDTSLRLSVKTATMVDAFCATWKLVDSENFDDYMKAIGKSSLIHHICITSEHLEFYLAH